MDHTRIFMKTRWLHAASNWNDAANLWDSLGFQRKANVCRIRAVRRLKWAILEVTE